jgi:hypothetical protein
MRVIRRIIFGIVAALGLSVVVIFTQQQVFNTVANELGEEAITNENFEFFISTRYYYKDVLMDESVSFGDYTFDLKIYNVANIRTIDGQYDVVEGFQIILHQKNEPLIDMPFSAILKTTNESVVVEFQGYQISQLPIFVFLDVDERSTFFSNRRFTQNEVLYLPNQIEILHFGAIIGSYDIQLKREDFKLKQLLETYIERNDTIPLESTQDIGYALVLEIDSTREVFIHTTIYVLGVFVFIYILFIRKRKTMGRAEASEGLKKDVLKVKHKETKDLSES